MAAREVTATSGRRSFLEQFGKIFWGTAILDASYLAAALGNAATIVGVKFVRLSWYSRIGERGAANMLTLCSVLSIAGGTCIACRATDTKFEKQADVVSGVLLVGGLAMIGSLLSHLC